MPTSDRERIAAFQGYLEARIQQKRAERSKSKSKSDRDRDLLKTELAELEVILSLFKRDVSSSE